MTIIEGDGLVMSLTESTSTTWDTQSEWTATGASFTRCVARNGFIHGGFRDDHNDGVIDSGWSFHNIDTNGHDEDATVAGELYIDLGTDKTTVATFDPITLGGSVDVTVIIEYTHQSTGTGEGAPQAGLKIADSQAGPANNSGAWGLHDRDGIHIGEHTDTGGETSSATYSNATFGAGPLYLKGEYDSANNNLTMYEATSDPVDGSGSWTSMHTLSPSYTMDRLCYWGDDGDASWNWGIIIPVSAQHVTESRDLGGTRSFDTLEAVASIPTTNEGIDATVEVSTDGFSSVADSTTITLSDGTNSYDISVLSDAQYVRIQTDFSSTVGSEDVPNVDRYTVNHT